jgi:hypothetical protein
MYHTKFSQLVTAYDNTNWEYIKLQARCGKNKPGLFKGLYPKKRNVSLSADTPVDWINWQEKEG